MLEQRGASRNDRHEQIVDMHMRFFIIGRTRATVARLRGGKRMHREPFGIESRVIVRSRELSLLYAVYVPGREESPYQYGT